MEQGHMDQAQARFREALQHNPLYAEAHRHLSYCVNGREDPEPQQAAQACLNELKDQAKAYHLYFCIGKYQQDRQDPAAADWFCKANQSRSAQLEGI